MKNENVKHTPGPWEVNGRYLDTPGGLLLDRLRTEHDGERSANMALISAAPELLEAAERALELIRATETVGAYPEIESALADAIAKARGER